MASKLLIGCVAGLLLLAVSSAQARESITVKIDNNATLIDGGEAVEVGMKISCPRGFEVLEAFMYVVQGENNSNFDFFPLICDGRKHNVVGLVSAAEDAPLFRRGNASVSVYILLLNPNTGETLSTSPVGKIKIR